MHSDRSSFEGPPLAKVGVANYFCLACECSLPVLVEDTKFLTMGLPSNFSLLKFFQKAIRVHEQRSASNSFGALVKL